MLVGEFSTFPFTCRNSSFISFLAAALFPLQKKAFFFKGAALRGCGNGLKMSLLKRPLFCFLPPPCAAIQGGS